MNLVVLQFILCLVDRPNPEGEVKMYASLSHSAPQLQVDPKTGIISMPCCKGYCSSKASHGVESGSWYFEVEIMRGSVRVGWSQALAEIQAPVGYDEYGYGISNKQSKIFHCSRGYSVDLDLAGVKRIGCLLNISDDLKLDSDSKVIEKIEKKYPPLNFLSTYNVKQEILKTGEIKFFAEGKEISGSKFENIYRAKYFPTVSIFGDAVVKVIFKENEFKFNVPEGASAYELIK
jgi:Set1/Ash2 histone methyltransferase complex subunit ASH2